jgi:hypothetical protein
MTYVLMTLSAEESIDALRSRSINVYWTDAAPVLDGKMDDACWKEAELVTDFRMFQRPAERATQQTEVRVCYDARNLYLFYRLNDDRMDKLFDGPPEDMRDMLDFNGDVAELFLDPGRTRKRKYQFCASPLGTRYDGGPHGERQFNPDWQLKPGIFADCWTLETAIPFAELALDGEFHGTPQKGDVWGIQFCRDQARLHEWTHWVPTPMSFHEVDKFGTATFQGRKSGDPLPTVRCADFSPLFFGKGSLEFSLENPRGEVQAECKLLRDKEKRDLQKANVTDRFSVPYHITKSGKWSVSVEMRQRKKLFYAGYTFSELPPVDEMLAAIETNTAQAQKRLKGFVHPAANELTQRVNQLDQEASAPLETLRKAQSLSRDEWKALLEGVKNLGKLWRSIEFDLHLVQIYPQGEKASAFAVGIAGPHDKVYRKSLFKGDLGADARVALAGREYESFQLVVIPFWTDLDAVQVRFSDLTSQGGRIPAENLRFSLVDYVRLNGIDLDHPTWNAYEPDILWAGKSFNVAKGQIQSIYVDVYCPAGTPAGDYTGTVAIEAAGQTIEKKITTHVYGFDLPEVASLENNFWFGPGSYCWGRFYGCGVYGKTPYTLEIFEKQAKTLSRYRITPYCDDVYTLLPYLTIYREKDGSFSFDFSTWAEFIRVGLKYGGNAWRASLSCNLGAMAIFGGTKVVDRATGESKRADEYAKEWGKAFQAGTAYWDTHPIYPQYLKTYVAFLKEMGILDTAHFEIYDEPNSNPRWLDMLRHHQWLKKHVPELKLTAYGLEPFRRQAGKLCVGLCDVWAPGLRGITPEVLKAMKERRTEYGEKFWFYTCGEAQDKNGNPSPYISYHRPYIAPRIHAWFAWQFQADGMLIFAISQVPEQNVNVKEREKQWPNAEWQDGGSRGCGTLIYPGPDFELIPGMRLASVRDGMEDYEYFKVLHDLSAFIDPQEQADLLARVRSELQIEKDIIGGEFSWTRDVQRLERKRERLAALITEVKKLTD